MRLCFWRGRRIRAPSDGGNFSFARPQIGKKRNAAALPSLPIRPQMKKDRVAAVLPASPIRPQSKKGRAAAVRIAHLDGRK